MPRTLTEIFEDATTVEELNAASDEIAERIQEIYDAYEPTPREQEPAIPPGIALAVAALRRRAAEEEAAAKLAELDTEMLAAVRRARQDNWSWEKIGHSLHVTGETARLRYRDLVA